MLKPGWMMRQKACRPVLAEAQLPFPPFSCVLLVCYCKFIDSCVGCGGHYSCWLQHQSQRTEDRLGDVLKSASPSLGKSIATFCALLSVCCLRVVRSLLIVVSDVVGITAASCTNSNNEPKLARGYAERRIAWPWRKNCSLLNPFMLEPPDSVF